MSLDKLCRWFQPKRREKSVPPEIEEPNNPPKVQSSKNYILLSSMSTSKIESGGLSNQVFSMAHPNPARARLCATWLASRWTWDNLEGGKYCKKLRMSLIMGHMSKQSSSCLCKAATASCASIPFKNELCTSWKLISTESYSPSCCQQFHEQGRGYQLELSRQACNESPIVIPDDHSNFSTDFLMWLIHGVIYHLLLYK